MIYADYAATTPVDPRVAAVMVPYLTDCFYNPSSLYPQARTVRDAVELARGQVALAIGAAADEIVFTSGGTEGDNLALMGTAFYPDQRRRHIIISAIEHHAVLGPCEFLRRQGFRVTLLPVDRYGAVRPEALRQAMTEDTFLVSIMWVNNEIGTVQDVKTLAEIAHAGGALFHSDGVQAMTTQRVDVGEAGVDMLTLSSHKFYGPKGCGALYVRRGTPLSPMHWGGQQEGFLRGGTENTAGIVGMGQAAALLSAEREGHLSQLSAWKDQLIETLTALDGVVLNSPPEKTAPSILNLGVSGVESEGAVFWLSRAGIMLSMGAACNTKSVEPSHVVQAIGVAPEYARGCLRISLGRGLSGEQVTALGQALIAVIAKLRGSPTASPAPSVRLPPLRQ